MKEKKREITRKCVGLVTEEEVKKCRNEDKKKRKNPCFGASYASVLLWGENRGLYETA